MIKTKQDLFNQVAKHLLAQGEKCIEIVRNVIVCRYHYNGLKCAIGAAFPDDVYKPEFEGCGVLDLWEAFPQVHEHLVDKNLACKLQAIHDLPEARCWPQALRNLAKQEGLKPLD